MESVEVAEEAVEPEETTPDIEEGAEDPEASAEQVDLDYDYAIARAAILLDTAGELAVSHRDTEEILKVSAAWMALSTVLSNAGGEEEDEDMVSSGIGFTGGKKSE